VSAKVQPIREMRRITLQQFQEELIGQGVWSSDHFAFRCPMCGTIQSAADLIAAGAGADFDAVQKYLAYSCVGRFTGKKLHADSRRDAVGCDWTLGGLFRTHVLEVIDEDGGIHPRFEPATPVDAQAHARAKGAL
jgi:hypothetical protein